MPPVIRSASYEDLPAIVEIYNEGVSPPPPPMTSSP